MNKNFCKIFLTKKKVILKFDQSTPIVLPKLYANVLQDLPSEYWDYENYNISYGNADDFEIFQKIGRGKYSEVFRGINLIDNKKVVIKILKPIKLSKIKREISILNHVKECPQIISIIDVVRDSASRIPSIITEYIENNSDFKQLIPVLNDTDIRYYMREILKALDYCHSKGIMHRDVKPQNIIVDHYKKQLKLIDWGLAEYYHPCKSYNVRVASRYFKGPELLLDYVYYDYSLDIWSTGAMFAGIIFQKEPFFQGEDNFDQLIKISKVLGTDDLFLYAEKYQMHIHKNVFTQQPKKSWQSFISNDNKQFCSAEAIDLLNKMLVYDHTQRITAKEALDHPYFDLIR